MRKLKVIPILSICIFIMYGLVSCRKEQTFTVKIFNPVTGEGYEGYDIQIVEGTSTVPCFGCPSESNVMFFGTTNADGEVLVTERFHKDYSYSVHVSNSKNVDFCYNNAYHEGYNTGGMKINLRMSKIEGSTAYLELVPCASLKYEINNINCYNSSDLFVLYEKNLTITDYFLDKGWPHEGCVNFNSDFSSVPIGDMELKWEVTKNGTKNVFYDTINLSEGEQRSYEINY